MRLKSRFRLRNVILNPSAVILTLSGAKGKNLVP